MPKCPIKFEKYLPVACFKNNAFINDNNEPFCTANVVTSEFTWRTKIVLLRVRFPVSTLTLAENRSPDTQKIGQLYVSFKAMR